jgi:hypothetical protein
MERIGREAAIVCVPEGTLGLPKLEWAGPKEYHKNLSPLPYLRIELGT